MIDRALPGCLTAVLTFLVGAASAGAACNGTMSDGSRPPGERAGGWVGNDELWTFALRSFVAKPHGKLDAGA